MIGLTRPNTFVAFSFNLVLHLLFFLISFQSFRDVVSEDIEDFEYTPKPTFPGTYMSNFYSDCSNSSVYLSAADIFRNACTLGLSHYFFSHQPSVHT